MIVAGVMSGTSVDGIDVAIIDIRGSGTRTRIQLVRHQHASFPAAVRRRVLDVMNATASVAGLAQLNFLLGELYADAVIKAQRASGICVDLIGCHGQTIYHQGSPGRFLGRSIAATWQIGEGAVIAARLIKPVVSDFRVADIANGGQGAPLVPFLDYRLFRNATRGRIVQNIGGIANLTWVPPGAGEDDVLAFDTGPGNMIIDSLATRLLNRPFDRNGSAAAKGQVDAGLLRWALSMDFFKKPPPKTAGREEFGREFANEFLRRAGRARPHDILATATALTAHSIAAAIARFVFSGRHPDVDYFISGGGTQNKTLMNLLALELLPLGLAIRFTDEAGIPAQAKEAVAFAVLAYETWHGRPSNLRAATGALRSVPLGKVSYPGRKGP